MRSYRITIFPQFAGISAAQYEHECHNQDSDQGSGIGDCVESH